MLKDLAMSEVFSPQASNPEASPSASSWYADWGNVLLAGLVVYVITFLLWITFEWGSERTVMLVREGGYPPVMLVGVVLAWRMARMKDIPDRTSQAWTVIGFAFLLWLAADSLWAYQHLTGVAVPALSLFDPAYLLSSLVLAAGILLFPAERLRGRDRTRFWIDCGIIITGLSALTAYIIVGPGYLEGTSSTFEMLVLLAYPISHMLVLIVVFSIVVRRPDAGSAGVLMLLGAGLFLYAGTDFWWTFLEVRDRYVNDALTYATWMLAQALLVASPQRHYDIVSRGVPSEDRWHLASQARVFVPYLAAAIGLLVIGLALLPEIFDRIGVAVVFLTILVALIVARQILTMWENTELRLQQAVRRSEERFGALVEFSSDMIAVLDRHGRITFQSPSSRELVQREPDDFVGTKLLDWVQDGDREQVERTLSEVLSGRSARGKFEWRLPGADGRMMHLETIASSEVENPAVGGIVLNSRDVTERKHLEARLIHQAYHDPLTDLPNRSRFFEYLETGIAGVHERHGIALLFVDIDNFKLINDTHGHKSGDEVLRQIATRLQDGLRRGAVLSRLAGDEFTILLHNLRNMEEAEGIAERVLESLSETMTFNDSTFAISPSIGVAYTESPEIEADELLNQADLAMYSAKRSGPGCYASFEPWMREAQKDLNSSFQEASAPVRS